jgi:hypothetical protein
VAALHAAIWCRIGRTEDARAVLDARGRWTCRRQLVLDAGVGTGLRGRGRDRGPRPRLRAYERLAPTRARRHRRLRLAMGRSRPFSPWPPGRWEGDLAALHADRAEALCRGVGDPAVGGGCRSSASGTGSRPPNGNALTHLDRPSTYASARRCRAAEAAAVSQPSVWLPGHPGGEDDLAHVAGTPPPPTAPA